jgi:2-phosphoglycerate kinase
VDRRVGDRIIDAPPWQVLLLGGASGVGKSQIGFQLAARWGARLTEVDDFQVVLERMTTPEQYPEVHRWRLHPEEVLRLDDAGMLSHTLAYATVMADALEPVIGSHIESSTPVVLEGDFILPSLATWSAYDGVPDAGQVRALFIVEPEEAQLARNFLAREGEEQPRRARASWHYNECLRLRFPAIPARPWETLLDRAIAASS